MMRRAVLATGATVAGVGLLLALKPHHAGSAAAATGSSAGRSGAGGAATGSPRGTSGSAGASANGTFTGDAVDTRYGPVQVRVTLAHGKLTGVKVLQAPSENGRDRRLTEMAVPRLTREALAAGNARIDTVSGATYTSEGYIGSLQSALDMAHA
ncbi:FMN-binding protein [Spirillospora sp. NPDC049652]